MKTFMQKKQGREIEWFVIDAKDKVLGRVATKVASILRGKDSPTFTPHIDGATGVIVLNAASIKYTGNKVANKRYFRHTGHPGGGRFKSLEDCINNEPEFPLVHAVSGMLPKNRLRDAMLKRLRVYAGEENPHEAQKATKIEL